MKLDPDLFSKFPSPDVMDKHVLARWVTYAASCLILMLLLLAVLIDATGFLSIFEGPVHVLATLLFLFQFFCVGMLINFAHKAYVECRREEIPRHFVAIAVSVQICIVFNYAFEKYFG